MVLVLKPPMALIAVHLLLAPAVFKRVDGFVLVPEGTIAHLVFESDWIPAVVVEVVSVVAVGTFVAGSGKSYFSVNGHQTVFNL